MPQNKPPLNPKLQHEFMMAVLGSMGEGLYTVDESGLLTYMNPAAAEILGWAEDDLLGKRMHDVIHWKRPDGSLIPVESFAGSQVLQTGAKIMVLEDYFIRKDDSFVPVCYTIAPLKEQKKIQGVVVVFRDITSLKQAEREINARHQKLDEANRLLTEQNEALENFIHVASHDLQEPLRKMIAFTEIIKKRALKHLLDEEGLNYLDKISNSAKRMHDLVLGLLSYTRVTALDPHWVATPLNPLLLEVMNDIELKIKEIQATIEIDTLPTLWVDPVQIRQLFQNLLLNAMKFQKPGVQPRIAVRYRQVFGAEMKSLYPFLVPDRHYAYISVEDNGIGIAENDRETIFKPFHRLEGKFKTPGCGLGLAVCKKIMDRHQGCIAVDSELEHGSRFNLIFPIQT